MSASTPQAQNLADLIAETRNVLSGIPGLRRVHQDVPESIGPYPCLVVTPASFDCYLGPHASEAGYPILWTVHTIQIGLYTQRKNLPQDLETIISFQWDVPHLIYAAFERDGIGGTMVVPGNPDMERNAFGAMRGRVQEAQWGSDHLLSWLIEFDAASETEIIV
ncbi:MAG: hypothetical protein MOGMAGMI_01872 [Candidatus Omnitrophica bacterium]|nr:hypothetical protein [Candidatus Omnitrophota bacterium]